MPNLASPELGEFSYQAEDVITFPEGLPSFEHLHEFVFVERADVSPFVFLISTTAPQVRFVCLPAGCIVPDYRFELNGADCAWLAPAGVYGTHTPELLIFAVVTLPEQGPPTANLLAPVVVHPARRVGAQVILAGSSYSHVTPVIPPAVEATQC